MCTGVPLTAPSNSTISLSANPTSIPPNGGVSVVTAVVIEPAGTPVPNGTVVFFFTNLGRVDAEGKTKDGIARVNFVSDSRSGDATVSASSGGPAAAPSVTPTTTLTTSLPSFGLATANAQTSTPSTVTIHIGSIKNVIVTANPTRITSPRSALITANVFDEFGNPVANIPVFFSIGDVSVSPTPVPSPTPTPTATPLVEETLESGGAPQYTDTNGQAFDWLRTRSVPGGPQKTVVVTATTATTANGKVEVFIN
jgi:hypothetical protein